MEKPFFSLIVPTINRTSELETLFNSLYHQTFKDFELLIIDQNEDDKVSPIIQKFSGSLQIKRIIQSEKGASKARNAGLLHAQGSIMTFPDDDCEYPYDLLERVVHVFHENLSVDGITCSTRDKNFDGKVARLSADKGVITKLNVLSKTIEFTIFVKQAALENILFDEDLGVGAKTPWWSDEGPDLVLRLVNKGFNIVYLPSIIIFHPNPVKIYNEKAFIRSYRYGLGRGRFLKKHKYPFWFVTYVWLLYVAGMLIGGLQFNMGKIKYYYSGLRGRLEGYLRSS